MPYSRLLIAMFLLATVLVDGVAVSMLAFREVRPWPSVSSVALLSLPFTQISLAAIWVGLGKKSSPWPLTGAFLLVVLWSFGMPALRAGNTTECLCCLSTQGVFILIPLSMARMDGLRLANEATADCPAPATGRRLMQFTLRDIFAWTTAVAVILGTCQYAVRTDDHPPVRQTVTEMVAMSGCNAVIALVTLWAALGSRRRLLSRWLLLVTNLTVAILFLRQLDIDRSHEWALRMLFLLQTLLLLASLWVFRVAGYRLQSIRIASAAMPESRTNDSR